MYAGNAQAIRIFSDGNVFIGSSPSNSGARLEVVGSTTEQIRVRNSGGGGAGIIGTDTSGNLLIDAPSNIYFQALSGTNTTIIGTVGQIMVNSSSNSTFTGTGNVGFGTTGPTQKVHIDGQHGQPATSGATQNGILRVQGGSGVGFGETLDMGFHVGISGPASYAWLQSTNTGSLGINYNLALNPNGGNVGINNKNPLAKLHVTYAGSDGASVKICVVGGSTNGNFIYSLASDYSDNFPLNVFATNHGSTARVNTLVRIHSNETADGGLPLRVTAQGSIASPTYEAIAVDYLGRVGIGTTSPGAQFTIEGTGPGSGLQDGQVQIRTTTAANPSAIGFINSGNTSSFNDLAWIRAIITAGNARGSLSFVTRDSDGSNTGVAERMRITSVGYLKAANNGAFLNATGGFHEINQSVNGNATIINRHSGDSDPYGIEVNFTGHDPNNATNYMFGAYKTSGGFVWIYRIFSNGTVSARSDARWKKNIETTRDGYIEDLCKLRVVKYNWYNHEDDAPKELGLIAQEVEEVFPNLIQIDPVIAKREVEQEDGTIIEEEFEDGVSRSIKTSVLPFMLLKAMQEQQAQIEELKAENNLLKDRLDKNNIN
jgi:hypothetical protein